MPSEVNYLRRMGYAKGALLLPLRFQSSWKHLLKDNVNSSSHIVLAFIEGNLMCPPLLPYLLHTSSIRTLFFIHLSLQNPYVTSQKITIQRGFSKLYLEWSFFLLLEVSANTFINLCRQLSGKFNYKCNMYFCARKKVTAMILISSIYKDWWICRL